jgi:hypothetical protein
LAWKFFVPLRARSPFKIEIPEFPGNVDSEVFFYSHGIALILNLRLQGSLSLSDVISLLIRVRRISKVNVQWSIEVPAETTTVDPFVEKSFSVFRNFAFGTGARPGRRLGLEPFTIFTVIKGKNVHPGKAVSDGGEIHRGMEALTRWSSTWEQDKLPEIGKQRLPTRSSAPFGDVLYANRRGRAIWFPAHFTSDEKVSSLSCYHRNMLFAALQVESLCGLMRQTADQIGEKALPAVHNDCARNAGGLLGRLYGADYSTYRSWSPRRQMDDNHVLDDINKVRAIFNMRPLS